MIEGEIQIADCIHDRGVVIARFQLSTTQHKEINPVRKAN